MPASQPADKTVVPGFLMYRMYRNPPKPASQPADEIVVSDSPC